MDRLPRNRLCIRLALAGLLNIVVYTIAYAYVGGDAWNGEIRNGVHYVRGHFVRSAEGTQTPVSKAVWIYSYLHSITIWPSVAAFVLSILVLARPHIIATCRDGLLSGATIVAVISTLVVLITTSGFIIFIINFILALSR